MPRKTNPPNPEELKIKKATGDGTETPQTGSDINEGEPVAAAVNQDVLDSQTGTGMVGDEAAGKLSEDDGQNQSESGDNLPEGTADTPAGILNSELPQTDPESDGAAAGSEGGDVNNQVTPDSEVSDSQTGTGVDPNSAGTIQEHDSPPSDTADSQTDTKKAGEATDSKKKSGGTKKAAGKKPVVSQSDTGQPAAPVAESGKIKPVRRRKGMPIVSIDETRSVETEADKIQNDLLDLVESMKGKRILTGTIQGVERSDDNHNISYAVLYHGEFKVIIPAEETVEAPSDFRDRLPGDVMHYMVTKRLGAEVDFIVKGVDPKSGIAAASRLEAMAMKRKEYYFGTDRDGNNLLYEGINAEARIVSVIRAGIFVDIFGAEAYIALKELSYQRWIDASQYFQPGQRVLVRLLSINRSDRTKIQVTASVKQAGENPYEKALRKFTPGSRYVGTVSIVDTNGVFVSLEGGIDCLCSYPKRGRPPRGSRVTVRVIGINNENNRIWGVITHMTQPR